ncbi:neuronal calcium sensor 1-like isoform X2 [Convolutriloba macropyga]|uniref:neuronal calcium sensor 1-like isoform X2 n=1 Tax=Convolutriloba macropyga TaxID=536237 RepID=UPI003F520860
MDVDPEDTVPAGNPRRRGAVTIGGANDATEGGGGDGGTSRRMSRRMSTNFKTIWTKMANSGSHKTNSLLEELEIQGVREKPQNLDALAKDSLFTKDEIKTIYRRFKQECPNGVLTEEIFRTVFQQFFPIGDTSQYAHFVYNTFKRNPSGDVTFASFVRTLSYMTKGSTGDKLTWIFNLYDIDRDGVLSHHDLRLILESMYFMVGKDIEAEETTIKAQINSIIEKMSTNPDNREITKEEFIIYCSQNNQVEQSIQSYTCGLF